MLFKRKNDPVRFTRHNAKTWKTERNKKISDSDLVKILRRHTENGDAVKITLGQQNLPDGLVAGEQVYTLSLQGDTVMARGDLGVGIATLNGAVSPMFEVIDFDVPEPVDDNDYEDFDEDDIDFH